MQMKFKIRLLNGELNGREILLPEGIFTFGENNCDVLLSLRDADKLTLKIEQKKVFICAKEKIFVNGIPFNCLNPLPLYQLIEIAGLSLILGKHDDTLSDIAIYQKKRKMGVLSGLLTIVLFFFLILIFIKNSRNQEKKTAIVPSDFATQLSIKLANPMFFGIQANWESDGNVILNGYCRSSEILHDLHAFLTNNGIIYSNRLVCEDHLITSVNDILYQNGYTDINVSRGDKAGTVIINGNIEAGPRWEKIQEMFNSIVGLTGWNVINNDAHEMQILIKILIDAGLFGYLSINKNKNEIIISGHLNNQKQKELYAVLNMIKQENKNFTTLVYQNIPLSDQTSYLLPAEILSYGGNIKNDFIELANGIRLQKGALLNNGYKVIYLSINGIQLMKDNNVVRIPFNF